jgi:energy-coupling factor transporter ATP-binding protein EcfA2
MITKLFGKNNYEIVFKDNKLIIVAENGYGKTTIVNMIYYFLSKQWSKLLRYNFHSISVDINGRLITLNKNDIDFGSSAKFQKLLNRYSPRVRKSFESSLMSVDWATLFRNPARFEIIAENLGIPNSLMYEMSMMVEREQENLFSNAINEKGDILENLMNTQLLYLPTYRRIEQDLKNIFPDLETDIDHYRKRKRASKNINELNYIELIEFGMEDVVSKIEDRLEEIKNNFNNKLKNDLTGTYLKDVINKNYLNIHFSELENIDEKVLSNIFNRINESVLSSNEKQRLMSFVKDIKKTRELNEVENKIIAHFIHRLSSIYLELQKEEKDIVEFIEICNEYLTNKIFVYDSINFNLRIFPADQNKIYYEEEITLKDLSSGEKQIVSLFSHIYLTKDHNFFIIIDEPELSLSVGWQQKFLPDVIKTNLCNGLLAVTHSPFIFDNILEPYVKSLNEFTLAHEAL